MMPNATFMRRSWGILIFGLFLMLLLQGCQKPLLNVEVKTAMGKCIPGEGKGNGLGLCFGTPWSGSADNFWNIDTQQLISPGSGLTCSAQGSQKCLNPGGMCVHAQGLGQCEHMYSDQPATGTCYCGCK